MPLTQMVLRSNSEVNDEETNVEDEEDNANFAEMSDEGANEGTFLFVIYITSLRQTSMWKNPLIKFVSVESLLYVSVVLTKKE